VAQAAQSVTASVVAGGFVIATLFGAIANRTNFCTMGALSDVVVMGHWSRLRMWLLAMAVAILGTGALATSGQINLASTVVQRPSLTWLSLLVGGLCCAAGAAWFARQLPAIRHAVRPIYVRMGILPEVASAIGSTAELTVPPER